MSLGMRAIPLLCLLAASTATGLTDRRPFDDSMCLLSLADSVRQEDEDGKASGLAAEDEESAFAEKQNISMASLAKTALTLESETRQLLKDLDTFYSIPSVIPVLDTGGAQGSCVLYDGVVFRVGRPAYFLLGLAIAQLAAAIAEKADTPENIVRLALKIFDGIPRVAAAADMAEAACLEADVIVRDWNTIANANPAPQNGVDLYQASPKIRLARKKYCDAKKKELGFFTDSDPTLLTTTIAVLFSALGPAHGTIGTVQICSSSEFKGNKVVGQIPWEWLGWTETGAYSLLGFIDGVKVGLDGFKLARDSSATNVDFLGRKRSTKIQFNGASLTQNALKAVGVGWLTAERRQSDYSKGHACAAASLQLAAKVVELVKLSLYWSQECEEEKRFRTQYGGAQPPADTHRRRRRGPADQGVFPEEDDPLVDPPAVRRNGLTPEGPQPAMQ